MTLYNLVIDSGVNWVLILWPASSLTTELNLAFRALKMMYDYIPAQTPSGIEPDTRPFISTHHNKSWGAGPSQYFESRYFCTLQDLLKWRVYLSCMKREQNSALMGLACPCPARISVTVLTSHKRYCATNCYMWRFSKLPPALHNKQNLRKEAFWSF